MGLIEWSCDWDWIDSLVVFIVGFRLWTGFLWFEFIVSSVSAVLVDFSGARQCLLKNCGLCSGVGTSGVCRTVPRVKSLGRDGTADRVQNTVGRYHIVLREELWTASRKPSGLHRRNSTAAHWPKDNRSAYPEISPPVNGNDSTWKELLDKAETILKWILVS
jgi:hypothetical protein